MFDKLKRTKKPRWISGLSNQKFFIVEGLNVKVDGVPMTAIIGKLAWPWARQIYLVTDDELRLLREEGRVH